MSSPDFLNSLKNMNVGSTYKASENKFDLGNSYSSYLKKDYSSPINVESTKLNDYSDLNGQSSKYETDLYKVDVKDYKTTITDGVNH